jgi:hypothetical protein
MASRKYMSRRNKSKSRVQKRKRTLRRKYGKKRGGFLEYFLGKKSSVTGGNVEETESTTPTQVSTHPQVLSASVIEPAATSAVTKSTTSASASSTPGSASNATLELGLGKSSNISGGKRRRRRKSSKKSRKGRKSRKSRRKQRGGCIGFAFQPSVVTPPNSALANPAPIARYTTGP